MKKGQGKRVGAKENWVKRLVIVGASLALLPIASVVQANPDHVKMLNSAQMERLKDPNISMKRQVLFLRDGQTLSGRLSILPALHYPFGGAITFDHKQVAMVGFYQRGEMRRMAYILQTGEVFIGKWPNDPIVFDAQGRKNKNSGIEPGLAEVDPARIEFIRMDKNRDKITRQKGVYSIVLAQGDRFTAKIESSDFTLAPMEGESKHSIDEIIDIRVRQGGMVGTLKGEATALNHEWTPIKDPMLVVQLMCNGQRIAIPWEEIDRIVADEGAFIETDNYRLFDEMDDGMVFVPPGKFIFGASNFINVPDLSLQSDESLSYTSIWNAMLFLNTFEAQTSTTVHGPGVSLEAKAFYMDRYEVTNQEYKRFIEATGHRLPIHWNDGDIPKGIEEHPVVNVSYWDASAYAKWAGKRLPTEVEWERAAKWQKGYLYSYGDRFHPDVANVDNPKGTVPIGTFDKFCNSYTSKMPQDLNGNVAEWTESTYIENIHEVLLGAQQPVNPDPRFKVVRGGSFRGSSVTSSSVFRAVMFSEDFNDFTGFRCVTDAAPYHLSYERGK
jgi:formylglycine-generating enzyme required for sulfatase activity